MNAISLNQARSRPRKSAIYLQRPHCLLDTTSTASNWVMTCSVFAFVHTDSILIFVAKPDIITADMNYNFTTFLISSQFQIWFVARSVPWNTFGYGHLFYISENRTAIYQSWFLSWCVTEYGEIIRNVKGLVVSCGLWFWATSPSDSHPASLVSWLLRSCRGAARSSCARLFCTSYWVLANIT